MKTIIREKVLICENGSSPPSTEETERVLNNLFPTRDIRKILLVNPPDVDAPMFRKEKARRGRYANYPPYGLAVLAQHLRAVHVEVHILNLNHEVLAQSIEIPPEEEFVFDSIWQKNLEVKINELSPDLIGMTCMFTMTHASLRNVCFYASQFRIPIAVGGVHVTNDIERVLDDIPQAQIAFLKEADLAFRKFVQVVNQDLPVGELGQLIISEQGTRHRYSLEHQPTSEDISIIPAYDLLDISHTSRFGTIGSFYHLLPEGTRCATALSNRGCRAVCTFCSVPAFNGRRVRQRTVTSVVDELERLQNEYGIRHVMWLDDDLFKDHRRTIDLFNQMVIRDLKLTWDASNGVIAASCTEEVIAAACDSGCIGLHIGMESGNRQILRQIKKPGTVETFLQAAVVLRKYEQIVSSVFIMIGFPGETFAMIGDTLDVARQMDLDWYSIGQLQPLPNTPIYDAMVADGLIQNLGSINARFTIGYHGRASESEERAHSFRYIADCLNSSKPTIPTAEDLTDLWFYMDYVLNYRPLLTENRPLKIDQQIKQLKKISEILYPDHSLALYFLGHLKNRIYGRCEPQIIGRLKGQLAASPYWNDRFSAFGLSWEDLLDAPVPRESLIGQKVKAS